MTFVIVTAVVLVLLAPVFITLLEWNHYWTKFYDWFVAKLNKTVHTHLNPLVYKTGLNSTSHQLRTFKQWVLIGFILEAVVLVVRYILFRS